jgi:hypothetical protein
MAKVCLLGLDVVFCLLGLDVVTGLVMKSGHDSKNGVSWGRHDYFCAGSHLAMSIALLESRQLYQPIEVAQQFIY